MIKTYLATVTCTVEVEVYVEAKSKDEAIKNFKRGGGWWQQADFQKHTAHFESFEDEPQCLDDDDENSKEAE